MPASGPFAIKIVLRPNVGSWEDPVEKVASLKWLQICQITNDIFDWR